MVYSVACCCAYPDLRTMNLAGRAIEMRGQVGVRVDPAGHHRQAAQIVGGLGGVRLDPDDLRPLDDERHVAQDGALPIEHGRRPNHDGTSLAPSGVTADNSSAATQIARTRSIGSSSLDRMTRTPLRGRQSGCQESTSRPALVGRVCLRSPCWSQP